MATWWELAIPVAGTLVGALAGTWLQARSNLRVLKVQNSETQRADHDKYEHERSMQLLEEKKRQYGNFLTIIEKWERFTEGIPERGLRRPDEMEEVGKLEEELSASFVQLYFIASPEVLEMADEIFNRAMSDRIMYDGIINNFIEIARRDLGVGGGVPRSWPMNREPPNTGQDNS